MEERKKLRKKIVDISKAKRRKEFDFENTMSKQFNFLMLLTKNSKTETKQAKKVGKKIIA